MRTSRKARVVALGAVAAGGVVLLASCAATAKPQPYRAFFVPPKPPAPDPVPVALPDPPRFIAYANEPPSLPISLPPLVRPTEAEFILRQAENYFTNGKRAFQEGRILDARRDFDRSIQVLLSAPESLPDRGRVEAKLEELIDAIYKYDLDHLASANPDDAQDSFQTRPLDEILELTFPVDPSLRSKVRKEIQGTGSELPLEETDAVLSFINYFTSPRGKRTIENGIRRSGKYRDMILRTLAEEGIPQELIFLAQAESGFFPRAVSYAKCVGIWQFAQFRGKEYGLMQTSATDDRMDPEQSTRAAARHLHDLFNHFGDWYLAMAAYNCGPNCVDYAVARTGYADFWTLRRLGALPQQTAAYVPAILAMTIVAKNAADYGIQVEYEPALEYDTIQLTSPTHVALAAAATDRPISEIRELNPALTKLVAPAGYSLHVPKGTLGQLEAAFRAVPPEHRNAWRLHKVEYGDTLASLSKRYSASSALIASANGGDLPEAGTFAAIPVAYAGDPVARPAVKSAKAAPAKSAAAAPKAAAPKVAAPARPAQAKAKTAPHPGKAAAKPTGPIARGHAKTSARRG
jgi:membrane-bound lytic murein transglycosylase D